MGIEKIFANTRVRNEKAEEWESGNKATNVNERY